MRCINLEAMENPDVSIETIRATAQDKLIGLTIDSTDAKSETAAGALIWKARDTCRFVVGSQGVEYALIRHWQAQGMLTPAPAVQGIGAVEQIAVVSGSASPITEEQIDWSRGNGFACIKFDALAATENEQTLSIEIERVVGIAVNKLGAGESPLVYTAKGPNDPTINAVNKKIISANLNTQRLNRILGESLGQILHRIINRTGITRAVISGGDTSGYATLQLGIFALSALAPTIPGAAIFKAHANGEMDGLELALKGGQMGSPDYFGWVRDGGGERLHLELHLMQHIHHSHLPLTHKP